MGPEKLGHIHSPLSLGLCSDMICLRGLSTCPALFFFIMFITAKHRFVCCVSLLRIAILVQLSMQEDYPIEITRIAECPASTLSP